MGHPGICCISAEDKKCPFHIPRVGNAPVDDFTESRMKFANATKL